MKDIRIGRLTLTNFQKIRSLTIEMGGADVNALGRNGEGKTTLANAIAYALYGKSSLGQTDFAIKTLGPDGEPFGLAGIDRRRPPIRQPRRRLPLLLPPSTAPATPAPTPATN